MVENDSSEYVPIEKGVRQGCVLSSDLYNLYSKKMFSDFEEMTIGIKVGGKIYNNLRFADDTVLIAESWDQLQVLTSKVKEVGKQYGLNININKTMCMAVSKQKLPFNIKDSVQINGENLKSVNTFKYLGTMINSNRKCEKIGLAKASFMKLKTFITNRNITVRTKVRLIKTFCWSVLLYGVESWHINKKIRKYVESM